jgi:hypothetical protein
MTDLQALLELSTDEIDSPDLARTALATAGRRRTRRRSAAVSVVAGVAVAGVVVGPRLVDTGPARELPSERPTPTPDPSLDPSPGDDGVMPLMDEDAIQAVWDPTTVVDLPVYAIGNLPTTLLPYASSQSLAGEGVDPVTLAVQGQTLAIFYDDAGWKPVDRPVPVDRIRTSSLSRDGSRAAVVTDTTLWWFYADRGGHDWTRVEVPRGVRGEGTRIVWTRDSRELILAGFDRGYLVDLDTGETTEQPHLDRYADFDVAPDGRVIARQLEARTVAEWDGTEQVTASLGTGEIGGLNDIAAFEDAFASTRIDQAYGIPRNPSDGDGIIVIERGSLETRAFLPVTGEPGEWVDAPKIRPVQWLNKLTVLLSVQLDDVRVPSKQDVRYLVAWDTMTGDMGLVSSVPTSVDLSLRDLYPA